MDGILITVGVLLFFFVIVLIWTTIPCEEDVVLICQDNFQGVKGDIRRVSFEMKAKVDRRNADRAMAIVKQMTDQFEQEKSKLKSVNGGRQSISLIGQLSRMEMNVKRALANAQQAEMIARESEAQLAAFDKEIQKSSKQAVQQAAEQATQKGTKSVPQQVAQQAADQVAQQATQQATVGSIKLLATKAANQVAANTYSAAIQQNIDSTVAKSITKDAAKEAYLNSAATTLDNMKYSMLMDAETAAKKAFINTGTIGSMSGVGSNLVIKQVAQVAAEEAAKDVLARRL